MERERGGGDDEVEHEVDGEEVREEARREDVAEDLGQIELGRVWHDRESERLKRMRSARPDRPGAGRAPATSPAPSVSPKRNGYLLSSALALHKIKLSLLSLSHFHKKHTQRGLYDSTLCWNWRGPQMGCFFVALPSPNFPAGQKHSEKGRTFQETRRDIFRTPRWRARCRTAECCSRSKLNLGGSDGIPPAPALS